MTTPRSILGAFVPFIKYEHTKMLAAYVFSTADLRCNLSMEIWRMIIEMVYKNGENQELIKVLERKTQYSLLPKYLISATCVVFTKFELAHRQLASN